MKSLLQYNDIEPHSTHNEGISVDLGKKNNDKDSKFEVGDNVRNININTFLQKVTLQIGLK